MSDPKDTDKFASLEHLFEALEHCSSAMSLKTFLTAAGVRWHEGEEPSIVADPTIKIIALGGMPFVRFNDGIALASTPDTEFKIGDYRAATESMMGFSGMMSYLNSGRKTAGGMFAMLSENGEMSVGHTVTLSLLVAGVSIAVENEFNSQRDLVHLSRVTVARSAVQNSPPLVVHDPRYVPAFREAWSTAVRLRLEADITDRDDLELANTIFPAAKATAFIMTASLRNLMKLLQQEQDSGKEREYRNALGKTRETLRVIWPGIF